MTTQRQTPALDQHLVIRISQSSKDYLTRTAKQYGIFPTTLARILVERELPHIQKNRFFEHSA